MNAVIISCRKSCRLCRCRRCHRVHIPERRLLPDASSRRLSILKGRATFFLTAVGVGITVSAIDVLAITAAGGLAPISVMAMFVVMFMPLATAPMSAIHFIIRNVFILVIVIGTIKGRSSLGAVAFMFICRNPYARTTHRSILVGQRDWLTGASTASSTTVSTTLARTTYRQTWFNSRLGFDPVGKSILTILNDPAKALA